MAKYGKRAHESVRRAIHEEKRGQLHSGKSGKKVKSRKQAIAIGLSEAAGRALKFPPTAGRPHGRVAARPPAAARRLESPSFS